MTNAWGYNTWVGIGTEGTWGTPATATKWIEINSEGLKAEDDVIHANSIYGIERDQDHIRQGQKKVAGSIEFDGRYEGWETILKYAFGSVNSEQQGTTSAYLHTFMIGDSLYDGQGLTVEVHRDISSFRYEGCKVNELTLSIDNAGILAVSTGFIAEDEGTVTASTPAFGTAPLIMFSEGALTWGGTAVAEISAASVTLNNSMTEDRYHIGSRLLREPKRGDRLEVSGSFTAEFTGTDKWNDFKSATRRAMQLQFTGDAIASGGTNTYQLTIYCGLARLTSALPSVGDSGLITAECSFAAYCDGTGTRSLQVTLRNGVASV